MQPEQAQSLDESLDAALPRVRAVRRRKKKEEKEEVSGVAGAAGAAGDTPPTGAAGDTPAGAVGEAMAVGMESQATCVVGEKPSTRVLAAAAAMQRVVSEETWSCRVCDFRHTGAFACNPDCFRCATQRPARLAVVRHARAAGGSVESPGTGHALAADDSVGSSGTGQNNPNTRLALAFVGTRAAGSGGVSAAAHSYFV